MASTGGKVNPTTSYAKMVQQVQLPTKDQAIVLDSMEGLTVQDYTVAIGNIVQPNNVRYISRISHGRVCVYLSTKEIADKLTVSRTKLNIVCPIIPSAIIEEELLKINIKPTSQITNIRAAISIPGYSHVLSIRRQMYVQPEDIDNCQILSK